MKERLEDEKLENVGNFLKKKNNDREYLDITESINANAVIMPFNADACMHKSSGLAKSRVS